MQSHAPSMHPAAAVRTAAVACAVMAAAAVLLAALIFGQPLAGGAFGAGVLLGTLNGAAASRLITLPVPFLATSLVRLVTLSMAGIAIGLAFGLSHVWLVILGLGFAQLALAAAALREQVGRT